MEVEVLDDEEVGGGTGIETPSLPNSAKGFGLPSVVSGTRVMLESRRLLNAGLEKMLVSSFMVLMLNKVERKSSETPEVPLGLAEPDPEPLVLAVVLAGEDTKLA